MATFSARIQTLVGTSVTDTEINDWATEGAREIINFLPDELLYKCAGISELDSDPTTLTNLDTKGRIFDVVRNDGFRNQPCRIINNMYAGRVDDPDDMLYFATKSDPVYYIGDNTLTVKPTPTSSQTATVQHVTYPTITCSDDSNITDFPDEAEYLVVLYTSIKVLQNKMNEMDLELATNSTNASNDTAADPSEPGASGSKGWETVRYYIEEEQDSELANLKISSLNAELQQFITQYNWYQGQLQLLTADYTKGVAALKGADQSAARRAQ
jgi:hypothetical protein